MPSIEIREYRDEDLGQVLEVLRLALGETEVLQRTAEQWAWKHELNPFGTSLVLVAVSGSRIVGVRAFMRWVLTTAKGEAIRCVRPVDTATHPEFHRMGIFRDLTLAAVDLARSDGVQLIFNTPNAKSGAGYLKMGWSEVGRIGVLARPSLRALRRGSQESESGYLRQSARFIGGLPDRSPQGLRTPRTEAYLQWRFQSHPTARYAMISARNSVAFVRSNLRKGRRELVISDVMGTDPRAAFRAVAKASTADYIVAWHSKGTPERRAAIAAGLLPVPGLKAMTLVANPLVDLPAATASLRSWDLAIGDLELL
jgi:GNAT superfamily N-acetyltransferase